MPVVLRKKMATYGEVGDEASENGILLPIPIGSENKCPSKDDVESLNSKLTVDESYSDNQLIPLNAITFSGSGTGRISVMAKVQYGNSSAWKGKSWSISSVPSNVTVSARSGVLSSGEWFIGGNYTFEATPMFTATLNSGLNAIINVNINGQSESITFNKMTASPYYINL